MDYTGVAEYLFRSPERLNAAIEAALYDKTHRSDDTEFCIAARGWSQCVSFGSFDLYRDRFEQTSSEPWSFVVYGRSLIILFSFSVLRSSI
jgi:prephenate dehydrogenase (NADP+)